METFKVTRVYADENGESRFDEVFYPLNRPRAYRFFIG
jgi:hypothetical protein